MDDDLHSRMDELIAEEHALRERHADGSGLTGEERSRLASIEERLDQTWDLLRQRQARRAAGQDAEGAAERSPGVVEGYLN
jgi:hypothetical protein